MLLLHYTPSSMSTTSSSHSRRAALQAAASSRAVQCPDGSVRVGASEPLRPRVTQRARMPATPVRECWVIITWGLTEVRIQTHFPIAASTSRALLELEARFNCALLRWTINTIAGERRTALERRTPDQLRTSGDISTLSLRRTRGHAALPKLSALARFRRRRASAAAFAAINVGIIYEIYAAGFHTHLVNWQSVMALPGN